MRKLRKIVGLILVIVLCASALFGCALVTRDPIRFNDQTVIYVGDEKISMSEFLSAFNNMYSNWYYHIIYGYITVSDVLSMTYNSLVNSYLVIAEYKRQADLEGRTYTHEWADKYNGAKYLTREDMLYVLLYSKYQAFSSLDSIVLQELKNQFKLVDPAEDESTVREAPEYEHISSLSAFNAKPKDEDTIREYLNKYSSAGDAESKLLNIGDYIFTNPSDPALLEVLKEINDRREETEEREITAEDYIRAQQAAFSQLLASIKINYGKDMDGYIVIVINDSIKSRITTRASERIYHNAIEKDATALNSMLSGRFQTLYKQAQQQFEFSKEAYIEFIDGLASATNPFIFNVPKIWEHEYIFTRNLLVPFSENQLQQIKDRQSQYEADFEEEFTDEDGVVDREKLSEKVKAKTDEFRRMLAEDIVAKNFITDEEFEGVFVYENATNTVHLNVEGELYKELIGANTAARFMEVMYKFNTDAGQHTATYPYAVRVGEYDSSYTPKWEQGYIDAAKEAYEKGFGSYAIGISSYGVHIVFAEKYVTADVFNFTAANIYNTETPEHRFFKAFYDSITSPVLSDIIETLRKDTKTSNTAAFRKFIKENGLTLTLED